MKAETKTLWTKGISKAAMPLFAALFRHPNPLLDEFCKLQLTVACPAGTTMLILL